MTFNGKPHLIMEDKLTGSQNIELDSISSASKSANILFTIELQRRLEGSGVEAFVLHPGVGK